MNKKNYLSKLFAIAVVSTMSFACQDEKEQYMPEKKNQPIEQTAISPDSPKVTEENIMEHVHFNTTDYVAGGGDVTILRLTFGKPWGVCSQPSWRVCRMEFFPSVICKPIDHFMDAKQLSADFIIPLSPAKLICKDSFEIPLLISRTDVNLKGIPYWVDPKTEVIIENTTFKAVGGYKIFDPQLGDKGGYLLKFFKEKA